MDFLNKHFGRVGNRMFQSFYLYAQARDGNIPDIFLQDYRYFDKYRPELMKLAFGNSVSDYDERVSLHVRRGGNPSNPEEPNYSENPFYVNLMDNGYYERAMHQFPNERFLVFSDDIEWCKKVFTENCDFYQGTEEEDFTAMAKCKAHIIANSSFSYMAAYLGGGKTVCPRDWYSDKVQRTICPSDWFAI